MQAWTSSSTYYLRLGENLGPQFLFPVFSFLFLSARAFACFGFATSLRWKFSRSNASLRLWVWFGTDRFVPTLPGSFPSFDREIGGIATLRHVVLVS